MTHSLATGLENLPAQQLLEWALRTHGDSFAICTSFQKEGMVILDMAARINPAVRVFTIDTGRLPEETYRIIEEVRRRYGVQVEIVLPDPVEVATMMRRFGPNLFYGDVAQRKLCCHVRKVRPLERKLEQLQCYAVGLRREQAETRAGVEKLDSSAGCLKLSPLADWSARQVDDYLQRNEVPLHPLYREGYMSIGCAPCTRPSSALEGERAGRWWWEQGQAKECGLHVVAGGVMRRRLDILLEEILRPATAA